MQPLRWLQTPLLKKRLPLKKRLLLKKRLPLKKHLLLKKRLLKPAKC